MNLLVVEDDDKIGAFVARGLEQDGHHVEWTKDGTEGLVRARTGPHDVVVVDLMLPGRSGLELIEELRAARVRVPILVLSAKSSVDDRVRGLESGADDYLTKPFSFAELVARIHALARRASEKAMPAPTALEYEDLKLDLLSRRATRGSREIALQTKEFTLLEYFLRNPERVLSRTMILDRVWEYAFDPQTNVVDVLVSRLRTKIDRDFETKLLHTIRGVGYVLRKS